MERGAAKHDRVALLRLLVVLRGSVLLHSQSHTVRLRRAGNHTYLKTPRFKGQPKLLGPMTKFVGALLRYSESPGATESLCQRRPRRQRREEEEESVRARSAEATNPGRLDGNDTRERERGREAQLRQKHVWNDNKLSCRTSSIPLFGPTNILVFYGVKMSWLKGIGNIM